MPSRRLALLLPQLPHDPASGAARNLRSMAQLLASGGYEVTCLATTATEHAGGLDASQFLRDGGIDPRHEQHPCGAAVLRFQAHGIDYQLLDVGTCRPELWQRYHGEAFDRLWAAMLDEFRPDIVLTYGATPDDRRRHQRARERGARIVFSIQNLAYLPHIHAIDDVDAVITCSRFVSDHYLHRAGLRSTPLPTPILPEEIIAPHREPLMVTFINPAVEKGLMFFVRLAEELCRRRPDIPLLVVEGRGTREDLIGAGQIGGFDLRRHQNLFISPPVAHPREIFAGARLLLAPSVWEEPAGRVAVEALVNGVPPIVSDRGGLPEVCAGGGIVLPIPASLNLSAPAPVSAVEVEPWLEQVLRLCDNDTAYAAESAKARIAAERYLQPALLETYLKFFDAVAGTTHHEPGINEHDRAITEARDNV